MTIEDITFDSVKEFLEENLRSANEKISKDQTLYNKIKHYNGQSLILEIKGLGFYTINIKDYPELSTSYIEANASREQPDKKIDMYLGMTPETWYLLINGKLTALGKLTRIERKNVGKEEIAAFALLFTG